MPLAMMGMQGRVYTCTTRRCCPAGTERDDGALYFDMSMLSASMLGAGVKTGTNRGLGRAQNGETGGAG